MLFFASGTGCVATRTHTEPAKNVVIFVPGYKGSTLENENGEVYWLTVSEALLGERSLALPISGSTIEADRLHAGNVVRRIMVIPWLYGFNAYGRFLDALRGRLPSNTRIDEFAYDWRNDISQTRKELGARVRKLRSEGAHRIVLVGHSMGGLVVTHYLFYGDENLLEPDRKTWSGAKAVDGALIAGTPFEGSIKMFCDMQTGTVTALNAALLSREALSSFPASFELLPRSDAIRNFAICGETDLFAASAWEKCGLGLLEDNLGDREKSARSEAQRSMLTRAKKFRSEIFATDSADGAEQIQTPVVVVVGVGKSTPSSTELTSASYGKCQAVLQSDDGDGIVTVSSATLPPSLRKLPRLREITLSEQHEYLLARKKTLQAIEDLISSLESH